MIDYSIPALQYKNLVYVRNLKCASTFFYNNLAEMGWRHTWLHEVSDDFTVFSHISDPVQRRHQGIAEYIDMCGLTEDYLQDQRLQNLLATAPILDRHSLTYEYSFGVWTDRIVWIPVQGTPSDTVVRTQQWLQDQGQAVDFSQRMHLHVHSGSPGKKQVVKQLEKNWNQAATLGTVRSIQQIWEQHYSACRDESWPPAPNWQDFSSLPREIRQELAQVHSVLQIQISKDLKSISVLPDVCTNMALTADVLKIFQKDQELWHKALKNFGLSI